MNWTFVQNSLQNSLLIFTTFLQLRNRLRETAECDAGDQNVNLRYSVWVSFAEIYNENVHDLLERLPEPKHKGDKLRRLPLKLAEDRGGAVYIKGLKEVPVTSADEAYQLLMIGRQNLQVYLNNISKLLFQLYVEVLMPLFFFSVRSDAAEPTLFAFPLYLYDKGGAGRSRRGSLLGPNFHAVILRSGRLREDQKDPQHGRPPEGGWKHQHILTRLGESHQGTPAKSGHQRPQEASTNTLQVTISSSVQNNLPRKIIF